MVRPPSLEETVGGLAEQLPEIFPQRFGQVGVDLRGADAGMPQQDLDDADVHAPLEQVRGKAVAERVRPELVRKAARVSRLVEGKSCGRVGQMSDDSATGEQPPRAAVGLPDFAEHLQDRFGQGKSPFLVPLANQAEHHLFRVDRRDGQRDRLPDSQSIGVDQREATAIDGLFQGGDQAAAVVVAADVREPLLAGLAHFFWVNSAHS